MLLIKALIYNLFKMIRKYQRDINLSLSEIYTYIYLSFLQRPFHLDLSPNSLFRSIISVFEMRLIAIEKFFRDLGDIITNILFYRFPIRNNYRYLTSEANYSIIDLKINSIPYFEQVFQDSMRNLLESFQ